MDRHVGQLERGHVDTVIHGMGLESSEKRSKREEQEEGVSR